MDIILRNMLQMSFEEMMSLTFKTHVSSSLTVVHVQEEYKFIGMHSPRFSCFTHFTTDTKRDGKPCCTQTTE